MLSQRQIPDYIHCPALVFVLGAPCNASNSMCRPVRVGKTRTRPRDLAFFQVSQVQTTRRPTQRTKRSHNLQKEKKSKNEKRQKVVPFSFLLIEKRGLNLMRSMQQGISTHYNTRSRIQVVYK